VVVFALGKAGVVENDDDFGGCGGGFAVGDRYSLRGRSRIAYVALMARKSRRYAESVPTSIGVSSSTFRTAEVKSFNEGAILLNLRRGSNPVHYHKRLLSLYTLNSKQLLIALRLVI
jgi:hypothetical protein